MTHLDLFSGIGGFALAADHVWPGIEHVFCDNEPFSQAILKRHWPTSKIYGDIRSLSYTTDAGTQEMPEWKNEVFLLTGGFPCQPFSQAGRRKGTDDDRYLWPEMLRVIREFHPRWVIGENVGGLVTWNEGMVLEQVHADLESEGYEVQAFIIPAVSLNAPHRRDRVWIVAHAKSERGGNESRDVQKTNELKTSERQEEGAAKSFSADQSIANSEHEHAGDAKQRGDDERSSAGTARPDKDVTNSESWRLSPQRHSSRTETSRTESCSEHGNKARAEWDQNWMEVATRLCTLDDGLPRGVVRRGRNAKKNKAKVAGWRNAALKAAGNAIVPQVAVEIMKSIKDIENII